MELNRRQRNFLHYVVKYGRWNIPPNHAVAPELESLGLITFEDAPTGSMARPTALGVLVSRGLGT